MLYLRKANAISLGLLLIASTVIAADSSDAKKLKASLAKWQKAKKANDGNYSYKVRHSSFTGVGDETQIVVRKNKVVERTFRVFGPPAPVTPGKAPKLQGPKWTEKGKQLGKHKEGAPVKTLDELYAEAAKVLERKLPQHERRYLRFDKQGLLLSCFTVDTRIADDAPTKGVLLASVTLGDGGKKPVQVYKAPNGKPFPTHWGAPPRRQTRDLRPLPGGYGRGSSTLGRWIKENMDKDAAAEAEKKAK